MAYITMNHISVTPEEMQRIINLPMSDYRPEAGTHSSNITEAKAILKRNTRQLASQDPKRRDGEHQ